MKLALLAGENGWHVQDLQRAGDSLGYSISVHNFRQLTASVHFESHSLNDYDAILVRTMPSGSLEQVVFRMDTLLRLEAEGMPVFNPPRALELCIDKYLSTARLAAAGLPVPPTFVCQDAESAMAAFERLEGDVVVKPLFGSEGRGLMRIHDKELAWRTFRVIERTQSVLYLQKFIPHSGCDLRLFVLGDQVLTAMRRYSNDWRTNVAQGAQAEPVSPSNHEMELALRASQALNVPIAGIDLLPGLDGTTYVLEANAVPGWRKLSKVSGIDVASEILQFILGS